MLVEAHLRQVCDTSRKQSPTLKRAEPPGPLRSAPLPLPLARLAALPWLVSTARLTSCQAAAGLSLAIQRVATQGPTRHQAEGGGGGGGTGRPGSGRRGARGQGLAGVVYAHSLGD